MEVFAHWWCIVGKENDDDYFVCESTDVDYLEKIHDWRYKACLFGFNIKGYDLRILNAIEHRYSPEEVFELSQAIINEKQAPLNDYSFWNRYIFCDLYDDWFGSLKEFESNIGMSIEETSVAFDKENLTREDKDLIIKYCKHDVDATCVLKKHRQSYIDSKKMLSEMFDIPLITTLKSTNAKLCALVLQAKQLYRLQATEFEIPAKVKPYITTELPQNILDLFKVFNDENQTVNLFDNTVTFGIGGIHSTYSDNIIAKADDTHSLINIDVTSYYPNLIMNFNYMSRNVPNPDIYKRIYQMRFEFKRKMKEELKANGYTPLYYDYYKKQEALKLILNTTYGAMKNEYNALYDPQQASSVCYLGQMLLAALANKIHKETHAIVVQTNTDGILVKISNEQLDNMKRLVSEWEEITGFVMEYDNIQMFFQRDVNNYIEVPMGVKTMEDLKVKGKWTNQENYNPNDRKRKLTNLNAPITHNAILNYYVFNKPISDTIRECNDLYMFCFTTKTGYTYDKTYYEYNGEMRNTNKVNRVIATINNRCGSIYKYKKAYIDENGKAIKERYDKVAEIPEHCHIVNDTLEMVNDLDYNWYIQFANNKLQDLVEI